jgi:uncharacterized GH25 family protein
MRRSLLPTLTLWVAVAGPAAAHELKVLASQQAVAEAGGKTTVYLSWGHRLPVDDLLDAAALERFELFAPIGTARKLTAEGTGLHAQSVVPESPGLYQAVATRKPSVFTYVIGADGQRVFRRGPKSAVTDGSKIDTATRGVQTAKAMIAVGPGTREPAKPLGLAAEITPLEGAAAWAAGRPLRALVTIDGKPLSFAEVVARPVGFKPDEAWNYATHGDKQGVVTIVPDRAGTWVLKVSHKRPAPAASAAEYDTESFTTTLSLEVGP